MKNLIKLQIKLQLKNNRRSSLGLTLNIPIFNRFQVKNNISNSEIQFTINDQLFLETLLMNIRGKSIAYSVFKKKSKH